MHSDNYFNSRRVVEVENGRLVVQVFVGDVRHVVGVNGYVFHDGPKSI